MINVENRKAYKVEVNGNIRIFPSDPSGSLDVFVLILGGVF